MWVKSFYKDIEIAYSKLNSSIEKNNCTWLILIQSVKNHYKKEVIYLAETLSGVNGNIIRWARELYNMDAEEAARAIGVDIERYNSWENGTGPMSRFSTS